MSERAPLQSDQSIEVKIAQAKAGDRNALESLVRGVQKDVYGVALRFLWHPQDARARRSITSFMTSRCGLANPANACRCRRRVGTAVALGRVIPANLLFASSLEQAKRFPQVLVEIRQLEETRRVAALYRSHPDPKPSEAFVSWLRSVLDGKPEVHSE